MITQITLHFRLFYLSSLSYFSSRSLFTVILGRQYKITYLRDKKTTLERKKYEYFIYVCLCVLHDNLNKDTQMQLNTIILFK